MTATENVGFVSVDTEASFMGRERRRWRACKLGRKLHMKRWQRLVEGAVFDDVNFVKLMLRVCFASKVAVFGA